MYCTFGLRVLHEFLYECWYDPVGVAWALPTVVVGIVAAASTYGLVSLVMLDRIDCITLEISIRVTDWSGTIAK